MGWSNAGWQSSDGGWYKNATAAAGPTFTYRGTDSYSGSNTAFTSSTIDIGTGTCLVIVALANQNNNVLSSVTVNGTSLTQDATTGTGPLTHIYSGVVTGAGVATIVATYVGAGFTGRAITVWTGTGYSSGLVKRTATMTFPTTNATITADAGDFMVLSSTSAGVTYAASSEAPTNTRTNATVNPPTLVTAEWNTIAGNWPTSSFNVNSSANTGAIICQYR